ncbi:MAG: phosphatidylserine decarboxylase [Deltaproteobacteria bacterium]|nr:phosphatidylserine decarboxylase [Deltaproteobacteria bacterium]
MTEPGPPVSLRLLGLYPKKAGSAAVGVAARALLPRAFRAPLLGRFAASYGVDLAEAEKTLGEYGSFLDFFTRRLKPGLRPQDAPLPAGVNSPVDGAMIASGRIEDGTLIQAKGLPYRLDELLAADPLATRFERGAYTTLYLSPRDYHRIHVPCTGRVLAVGRVEGELWPVNEASTAFTPGLYVRNRRAYWIAEGTGEDEGLDVAAVMVAATHVGGVVVDARWLEGRRLAARDRLAVSGLPCVPGDDLGTFELGSTVVLLVGGAMARSFAWSRPHGPIRVGQRLGAIAAV